MLKWDWGKILSVLSVATIAILHSTGADQHRTIAGDIAKGLGVAAPIAGAVHDALSNQNPGTPS